MNSSIDNILVAFEHDLRAAGLLPDVIDADGNRYYCPTQKHPGNRKQASYCLYPESHGYMNGWLFEFSQGKKTFSYRMDRDETPEDQQRRRKQAQQQQTRQRHLHEQQTQEEHQRRTTAQEKAAWIWEHAQPADTHPYLTEKGVNAYGLRLYKGSLVVPVRDIQGQIHTLQFISRDKKVLLSDGAKTGHFFEIPADTPEVCLCEGYATGASIHEATGLHVVVAIDCQNLPPVYEAVRTKYPDKPLILCADNDAIDKDGSARRQNPGLDKAIALARRDSSVKLAVPQFVDVSRRPSDFNDLHRLEGLEAVRTQVTQAAPLSGIDLLYQAGRCAHKRLFTLNAGEYLGDCQAVFDILNTHARLQIIAGTGTGKTTAMRDTLTTTLSQKYHVINAMPTRALTDQKAKNEEGIEFHVVKQGSFPSVDKVQLTTWASMTKFTDDFRARSVVVIDEPQLLIDGLAFRRQDVLNLLTLADRCAKVIFITATPASFSTLYTVDIEAYVKKAAPRRTLTLVTTDDKDRLLEQLHSDEPRHTKLVLCRKRYDCEMYAQAFAKLGYKTTFIHARRKLKQAHQELLREGKLDPKYDFIFVTNYIIQGNDILIHNIRHLYSLMWIDPMTAAQFLGRLRGQTPDLTVLVSSPPINNPVSFDADVFRDDLTRRAQELLAFGRLAGLPENEQAILKKHNPHYRVIFPTADYDWNVAADLVELEVFHHWQAVCHVNTAYFKNELAKFDIDVIETTGRELLNSPATLPKHSTKTLKEVKKDARKALKQERETAFLNELTCTLNMSDIELYRETRTDTEAKQKLRALTKELGDRERAFHILWNIGSSESKFRHVKECAVVERYRKAADADAYQSSVPIEMYQDIQSIQEVVPLIQTTVYFVPKHRLPGVIQTFSRQNSFPELLPYLTKSERARKTLERREWLMSPDQALRVFRKLLRISRHRKRQDGLQFDHASLPADTPLSAGLLQTIRQTLLVAATVTTRTFITGSQIFAYDQHLHRTDERLALRPTYDRLTRAQAIENFRRFHELKRTTIRRQGKKFNTYEIVSDTPLNAYDSPLPEDIRSLLQCSMQKNRRFDSSCPIIEDESSRAEFYTADRFPEFSEPEPKFLSYAQQQRAMFGNVF